jgi:hypothetical protein
VPQKNAPARGSAIRNLKNRIAEFDITSTSVVEELGIQPDCFRTSPASGMIRAGLIKGKIGTNGLGREEKTG